ncbi:MAG: hypothetical protein JW882_02120 [Deltaproteobacteria bacterium]|nr:hypothetical protein [Deltaproteobacteria bacterium]
MPGPDQDIIVDLIKTKGPLTGFEVIKDTDMDSLQVWKLCKTSRALRVRIMGKRYMRLDRHVDGFARLSPSILREFLTYSVVGLSDDPEPLEKRCVEVSGRIHEISRFKLALARRIVSEIMEEFEDRSSAEHRICFIVAGDIVYDMAHDVPRPERSTGKLVKGSDIDLIAVTEDSIPDTSVKMLDDIIFRKKYRMLIDPAIREEIDYKIKSLPLIRNQARFDNFRSMVAIKILQEGLFLHGSEDLFHNVKKVIEENGLLEKLEDLEKKAIIFRRKAEEAILDSRLDKEKIREMHLFYSAEEFEEFE